MDRFLCFSSNISFKYDNFKLKYIMYNVQDYSVLYNNVVLLICGMHLLDCIISLGGDVWFKLV